MIKLKDAIKLIKENESSHCYSCYLPGLDKEVSFRPLTVSELKSVAKISIDEEEMYTGLTALLHILCIEDLDMSNITEIDKTRALLTIKVANNIGEDEYNITCKSCNTKFNYVLPITDIIENFKETPKERTVTTTINDIEYKLILGMPSLELTSIYNNFTEDVRKSVENNNYDDEQQTNILLHLLKYSSMLFVKKIFINDNEVEEFSSETKLDVRNEIIDVLPANIIDKVNDIIAEEESYDINLKLSFPMMCPKCKLKSTMSIQLTDFFVI